MHTRLFQLNTIGDRFSSFTERKLNYNSNNNDSNMLVLWSNMMENLASSAGFNAISGQLGSVAYYSGHPVWCDSDFSECSRRIIAWQRSLNDEKW